MHNFKKPLFCLFTFFIFTINFVQCQSIDSSNTTTQKIIKNKVIDENQKKDFEELVKKMEHSSDSEFLKMLMFTEYLTLRKNFNPENPEQSINNEDILKPTSNEDLIIYLSKLKLIDLIDDKVFQRCKNKIEKKEINSKLQLLQLITEEFASNEFFNPIDLKLFAVKLKNKEIVTSEYNNLILDIEKQKFQNPIYFLNYCNKAVVIKHEDYSNEPEKYLELIHKKTATIIPELKFTNFKFKIELDSSNLDTENEFKLYNYIVSIDLNGKTYKQKSSCCSDYKNKLSKKDRIDQQEYYEIFNKVLIDLQSPYRLHEVKAYQGNAVDWSLFGVIALTKEQAELLHGPSVLFRPTYKSFKNKLTSNKIEETIEQYRKIKLFSHLTTKEIENAKAKVFEKTVINTNDILIEFPNVIHYFDTELNNLTDPYAELMREYIKISHNELKLTEISDNFDTEKNEKVLLKFKVNNKLYKKYFEIDIDWIDNNFFDFMRKVAKENKLRGQFYNLYTGEQDASVIYLTKEQYDYLKSNKLLVFEDEQPEQEE